MGVGCGRSFRAGAPCSLSGFDLGPGVGGHFQSCHPSDVVYACV